MSFTRTISIPDDLKEYTDRLAKKGELSSVVAKALKEYRKSMREIYQSETKEEKLTLEKYQTLSLDEAEALSASQIIQMIGSPTDIPIYLRAYYEKRANHDSEIPNTELKIMWDHALKLLAVKLDVGPLELERWQSNVDLMEFRKTLPKVGAKSTEPKQDSALPTSE